MRPDKATGRIVLLHLAVVAALFLLQFVLPAYHHGVFARIMVLAVFAMGYNILFGYTGLLSLGHAMFFCAGLYGAGLTVYHLGWSVPPAFLAGLASGLVLSIGIGVLALRTTGVAFLIVTLMFGQIFYLLTLYFAEYTRGDDGIVLSQAMRRVHLGETVIDLTNPATRYLVAWALFSTVLFITLALVRAPFGRVLVAIRENEERTRMLGYDTFVNKLSAMAVSGVICAAAGAAYALLFGYAGASFAEVHFSILPLLWVLTGGAATVLGPLIGTLFMFYVVDITSGYTAAYMLVVGAALIFLILFFPKGLLGSIRERWVKWLP
jgi:branched-chain amino acid transport system permease protein